MKRGIEGVKSVAILSLATALLSLSLGGCVALSPEETPGQFMNSAVITSSVKARLANTAGLETLSLTVETLGGDVLLSGFVRNEEQKKQAEYIALTTEGVNKVINNIVVR